MLWRAYTAALQSHPLRTNAASSGFIGFCGDAIAQRIEHNSAETSTKKQQWWDSRRAAMLSIWGVFGNGIPGTLWFRWLSLRIPVYLPRPGESKTALHLPSLCRLLAVHLCTYAPASNTVFYGYKEAFSGDAATWAARYERRMRQEFVQTTTFSLLFWIPAQSINFTLVPLHLRPVYANSLMCVWNAFLSYSAHKRLAGGGGGGGGASHQHGPR
jgi:protein Mpv17